MQQLEIFKKRVEKINPKLWEAIKKPVQFFSFRQNFLKEKKDIKVFLKKEGFEDFFEIDWQKGVYVLSINKRKKLVKSSLYTQNKIYIHQSH